MVRERVGDWRLAWRFALAGLIAGLLVIALAQTPATGGTFDAAQDRLFPAPGPDPEITLVAIDTATQNNLGIYPFSNANHAQVINYLASPHPKSPCPQNESDEPAFIQALRVATGINDPLEIKASVATFGDHRIPLVGGQMLINLTRGSGSTCSYVDAYNSNCPHPELITNHIVVVGTKLVDAGDVYSQAVAFPHDVSFCSR